MAVTANLLTNSDWRKGFTTIVSRENMRVPNGWYFSFYEGKPSPSPMEDEDVNAALLAPEMTFRSANGEKHGDTPTERLPADEVDLFLAPDVPVVYHVFKGWGKQWWKLGIRGNYQALQYKFGLGLFNDCYFSQNGARVFPDKGIAIEWRVTVNGQPDPDFSSSLTGFRKWHNVERTFTHPGGLLDVALEVRARWGIDVVGVFLRRPSLIALNAPDPNNDGGTGGVLGNDTPAANRYATLTNSVTSLKYDVAALEPLLRRMNAGLDVIVAEAVRLRAEE